MNMINELFVTVIKKLIVGYPKYGFLYDNTGRLKDRFMFLGYEPPEYDLLCDSKGKPLCYSNSYEDDEENGINRYFKLDKKTLFTNIDVNAFRDMSNREIERAYLSYNMDKLVAMLRFGHNYASKKGIGDEVSDISLKECIIACWKEKAMDILTNETYEPPVARSMSLKDLEEMLSGTKSQTEIKRRRPDSVKRQDDLCRVIEMSKISSDKKKAQRIWDAIKEAYC